MFRTTISSLNWWAGGIVKQSWGIRISEDIRRPAKPQIWEDLDNFLQTRWRREDGAVMNILAAAMDTGGHHTDAVYRFCLERWRHLYALSKRDAAVWKQCSCRSRQPANVGVPLYTIGVDNGKTMVYQRLNVQTPGRTIATSPLDEAAGYDETYFKGLTAEKQVVRWKKGRPTTAWELKRRTTTATSRWTAETTRWPHWKLQTRCWKTRTRKRKCWRFNIRQDEELYREVLDKWQESRWNRQKRNFKPGWKRKKKIASGQGYSIGDRRLTRADLYTVRGEIEYWNNKVKELETAATAGRNKMYRFVPRDI